MLGASAIGTVAAVRTVRSILDRFRTRRPLTIAQRHQKRRDVFAVAARPLPRGTRTLRNDLSFIGKPCLNDVGLFRATSHMSACRRAFRTQLAHRISPCVKAAAQKRIATDEALDRAVRQTGHVL